VDHGQASCAWQALTEEKLLEERKHIKHITDCLLDKDATMRDLQFENKALKDEVEGLTLRVMEQNQKRTQDDHYLTTVRNQR
jgi:hypothetical protein